MKNIVVATKKNVGYYNILEESCKRNNIKLITLGLGKKWTGFHLKFKLWYNYLKKLDDKEIIMLNDAYDVIILQNSKTILEKFKKYNTKVLFCAQKGVLANMVFNKFKKNVIGSGSIIGEVKYLKKIVKLIYKYKKVWKKLKYDDQVILGYVMIKECSFFKKYVEIDKKQNFFFATDADDLFYIPYILNKSIQGLKMKNGKIYNKNNIEPVLLHLAANVNGNKYLKYLGYNTKNLDLHGEYKITQLLNFGFIFLSKNIVSVIFILLLTYKIYFNNLK